MLEVDDWSKLALDGSQISISKQPKIIGYWVLYPQAPWTTKFGMYHKPTAEQIQNTEQLLGWGWEDIQ